MRNPTLAGLVLFLAVSTASATEQKSTCVIEHVSHLGRDFMPFRWEGWTFDISYDKSTRSGRVSDRIIQASVGAPVPVTLIRKGANSIAFDWAVHNVPVSGTRRNAPMINFRGIINEKSKGFILFAEMGGGVAAHFQSRGSGTCAPVK